MNNENKVIIVLGVAILIGIVIGISLVQKVSGEIKEVSSNIKNLEISIKGVDSSIKGIDSSVKEVKTSLAEKDIGLFRRQMQENGRRILFINYAGKLARWDAAKNETNEMDKALENAADMRSDLAQAIQGFRSTYIPKLKDAADRKDSKSFEAIWNDAYNACIACHQSAGAPGAAFDVLREVSSEVDELSG
jgi:mono/diheme cytochrome c family protein